MRLRELQVEAKPRSGKGDLSPGGSNHYAALAAAVLLRASQEAQAGDYEAALWLCDPAAAIYAEALGLDDRAPARLAVKLLMPKKRRSGERVG